MTNVYHLIDKLPPIEKWEMSVTGEQLVDHLIASGLMRIDAGDATNFTRFAFTEKNIHLMFSYKELHDPKILPLTVKTLTNCFSGYFRGHELSKKVQMEITKMRKDFVNYIPIHPNKEKILARLFVSSTEPIIINFILLERVQVFLSFAHSVGDVMDVQMWQQSGSNSGLQSMYGQDTAIYVTCGGDPFANPKTSEYFYDGFRAQARLMIIAGQEIGHFADIKRDAKGNLVTRHSTNIYCTKPKPNVKQARHDDLKALDVTIETLDKTVFRNLAEQERHHRFYKKHKRFIAMINCSRRINNLYRKFYSQAEEIGYSFVNELSHKKYAASLIAIALEDMRFNIEPKADVYKDPNPEVEESIACAEALARVPQQVIKWGHPMTRFMMPNLYRIYYTEVIPEAHSSYENIYHETFKINNNKIKQPIWQKILGKFKKNPYRFKPVGITDDR